MNEKPPLTTSVEITELVEGLLSSADHRLDEIAPQTQNACDAIEYIKERDGISNIRTERFAGQGERWSLAEHIHQRLGHLIVNPSRAHDTSATLKTYVFPNPTGLHDEYVNYSPDAAEHFINKLIFAAHRQQNIRQRAGGLATTEKASSDCTFVIHGARGCGKTFLLNYLLAKFDTVFDQEDKKIIWIRLNLVDDIYSANLPTFNSGNLQSWIYGQTAKIVLRFYDEKSKGFRDGKVVHFAKSPSEALREYVTNVENVPEEFRNEYIVQTLQQLKLMIDTFFNPKNDAPLSERLVPDLFGKFIFDYVQQQGYSIVLVFDGLDVLEGVPSARMKFSRRHEAIKALLGNHALFGVARADSG